MENRALGIQGHPLETERRGAAGRSASERAGPAGLTGRRDAPTVGSTLRRQLTTLCEASPASPRVAALSLATTLMAPAGHAWRTPCDASRKRSRSSFSPASSFAAPAARSHSHPATVESSRSAPARPPWAIGTPLSNPTFSGSADGSVLVTWTDFAEEAVFGQRYDRAGRRIGDVFRVEDATNVRSSAAAADAHGNSIVTWVDASQTLLGQRLDGAGNPRSASFEVTTDAYYRGGQAVADGSGRRVRRRLVLVPLQPP